MLYTADVAVTIGALLERTEARGPRAGQPGDPPGDARGRVPRSHRPGAAGVTGMHALVALTRANIRSFVRDRTALFWTLAFPVIFILLFGAIFSGTGGSTKYTVGWADADGTPASAQLRQAFEQVPLLDLQDGTLDASRAAMQSGDLRGIIVVPQGYGAAVAGAQAAGAAPGSGPAVNLEVYTDPSQQTSSGTIVQIVSQVTASLNVALTGSVPGARGHDPRAADAGPHERGVPRARDPGHGADAARDLRRGPAGRAAREADPQAAGRDTAAPLDARGEQRRAPAADRPRAGGPDRGHRGRRVRRPGARLAAAPGRRSSSWAP